MSTKDIIDMLAGIEPGSGLDAIRARRLRPIDLEVRIFEARVRESVTERI